MICDRPSPEELLLSFPADTFVSPFLRSAAASLLVSTCGAPVEPSQFRNRNGVAVWHSFETVMALPFGTCVSAECSSPALQL